MAFRLQENPTMWVQIRITAIGAAFLAGTAAVAYGQDGMTQNPGPIAPGNLPTDRLGPGSASPATGGYGTLGAMSRPELARRPQMLQRARPQALFREKFVGTREEYI
jgi:hypothetical protein